MTIFSTIAVQRTLCHVAWVVSLMGLAACANQKAMTSAEPPQAEAPVVEATPLGDQVLAQGVQMYQSAKYDAAETLLKTAVKQGMSSGVETARAHKFLAFIYCTSKREALCAAAFKQARQSDPSFELSKAEAGHPIWGPVYRKSILPMRAKP
jgi:Tfp pilus assembly protein PilF